MAAPPPRGFTGTVTRKDFPEDFLFGSATSAFQYEGAPDVDGRGPSIWDTFLKENHPEIVAANGLNAVEFYFRYEEDIKIMKDIGFDTFRFSLSWPRILPNGRRTYGPNGEEQGVNQLGIDFYKRVINRLLENGIEPSVTLFHWDLPQPLETEYLGFLSDKSVEDFVDYADLCYREFGDRVKYWMTFNETWTYALNGYVLGTFPPGRGVSSEQQREFLANVLPFGPGHTGKALRHRTPIIGDPSTEPYIAAHNQLLGHAAAVKLYREKYQKIQHGKIGLGVVTIWAEPHTDTQADRDAAQRVMDFMLGWLFDPIVFGKYPESMRRLLGNQLPEFTPEQVKDLVGSFDFIGFNYYTAGSAADASPSTRMIPVSPDSQTICYHLGEPTGSSWVYSHPEGFLKVLLYVKERYNNPILYITENGVDETNDDSLSMWEALYDHNRVNYYRQHIDALKQAMSQGVNVKGYYAWSLMDNLEWVWGFDSRFGVNFIHFGRGLERYPKLTAGWFKFFLEN